MFWFILLGSVLPDVDMLYFYLVDNRNTNHHLYWTHLPIFWVAVLGGVAVIATLLGMVRTRLMALCLFAGIVLHLLLDTLVGGILWLFPYETSQIYLIKVPAVRSWWVWNFVLHWTFMIEIAICVMAAITWFRRRKRGRNGAETAAVS